MSTTLDPPVPTTRYIETSLLVMSFSFGWFLFGSGAIVPRLQDEYDINRTVASLHSVAMAVATVGVAVAIVPVLRRIRRGGALAFGGAAMALGAVFVVVAPSLGPVGLGLSILGFACAGGGSALVSTGTTGVVDARHGPRAGSVLSAVHGVGAVAGVAAPLVIGAGIALGLTWRPGFLIHSVLMAGALVLFARVWSHEDLRAGPPPAAVDAGPPTPMPLRFWIILVVVMSGVGLEFAFTVWAGDLLVERTAMSAAAATAVIAGVVGGMAIGRLALSRAARRVSPGTVMSVACVVVLVGWSLVWTATLASVSSAPLAVSGLIVSGVGIGAFFPLGVAWLVAESLGRPEAASARLTIGAGVASGIAPFALGAAADQVGVHTAFVLVPVVVAIAIATLAVLARGQSADVRLATVAET